MPFFIGSLLSLRIRTIVVKQMQSVKSAIGML